MTREASAREQARDQLRAQLAGVDLVAELQAERRAEAAREDSEAPADAAWGGPQAEAGIMSAMAPSPRPWPRRRLLLDPKLVMIPGGSRRSLRRAQAAIWAAADRGEVDVVPWRGRPVHEPRRVLRWLSAWRGSLPA